jgi:hypothetical protein
MGTVLLIIDPRAAIRDTTVGQRGLLLSPLSIGLVVRGQVWYLVLTGGDFTRR